MKTEEAEEGTLRGGELTLATGSQSRPSSLGSLRLEDIGQEIPESDQMKSCPFCQLVVDGNSRHVTT